MTEAQLQDRIVDLARTLGWRAAHFRPAQTKHGWRTACQYDAEGWPDLFLVHPLSGDKVAAEVKTWARRNSMSEAQANWLCDLRRIGMDTYVWTERDWDDVIVPRLVAPTNARVA